MKKWTALLLSLMLIFTCTCVLAETAEETAEPMIAHYQFRNLTGDTILVLTLTDNKTGEVQDLLSDGTALGNEMIIYFTLYADENETKEDLEHRYTLTFSNGDEEKTYEFKTLSFENVLIDLLAEDAMTGATPIQFNPKMYQVGNFKIVNNTGKVIQSVTFTEKADPNNSGVFSALIDPDSFGYVNFIIEPDHETKDALTVEITFADGTSCSIDSLSLDETTLTVEPAITVGPAKAE